MTDEQKKSPPPEQTEEKQSGGAQPESAPPPKAATPPAKPPARPRPPGPEPLDNELTRRLRARFGEAIGDATCDRGQNIVVVQPHRLLDVGRYLKEEEGFDFLTDLTALDHFDRRPRFDAVLNLYSFSRNARLRLKVPTDSRCPSVATLWGTANWLERECYDMFGIEFEAHPDLRRILLPDDWKGHPLRKDYDILQQDADWVRENLGIESGQ